MIRRNLSERNTRIRFLHFILKTNITYAHKIPKRNENAHEPEKKRRRRVRFLIQNENSGKWKAVRIQSKPIVLAIVNKTIACSPSTWHPLRPDQLRFDYGKRFSRLTCENFTFDLSQFILNRNICMPSSSTFPLIDFHSVLKSATATARISKWQNMVDSLIFEFSSEWRLYPELPSPSTAAVVICILIRDCSRTFAVQLCMRFNNVLMLLANESAKLCVYSKW